jgi:hypothetical protein
MASYRVPRVLPFAAAVLISAGCAVPTAVSGFRPVYPEVTHSFGPSAPDILDWTKVDSLQPTLRWQAFPGEHQDGWLRTTPFIDVNPGSVRDVRYDLRIWTVLGRSPGDLVYEIDGLTEPSHKLDRSLKPDTEYYWTVRARFTLDGQPRASEWSLSQIPCAGARGCGRDEARQTGRIPPLNHYRFKTPAQ